MLLSRPWKLLCWTAFLLVLAGCQKQSLRSQNPDDDEVEVKKTQFIGDQVTISGLHVIQIECVGLVTNLDGTGGDTPPSVWRTLMLDELRRRGVKTPNTVLNSPNNALVIVRAVLPPVIAVGDPFDVEVTLPPGSEATSLKGGRLMECRLAEQAIIPGQGPKKGHTLGVAEGPVMLSASEDGPSASARLSRGRVLGGGRYTGGLLKTDRNLGLYARNEVRGTRTTDRIAKQIGTRFFHFDHGIKRPLSKAKTDQYIELKVHPRYKENYVRYIQVIRHIALNEKPLEQRERIERLCKSLIVPQTASRSAMELEAIGPDSILILKEGLKSPSAEVRFYSADSLAYLGDNSGAKELAEAARNEPAFRVFSFAALATIDDPVTRDLLHDLMVNPTIEETGGTQKELWSAETRYGAFHTLWTIDKNDEFVRGEPINRQFFLHVVKSDCEPMIHLSTHRSPEVVVFGEEQRLQPPIMLSAGKNIMLTAQSGSDQVHIVRFEPGVEDEEIVTSTRIVDVIRGICRLGAGRQFRASYPDIAQMLMQAEHQANLPGRLELDSLPQAGRIYYRPQADVDGIGAVARREKTQIGRKGMVPNLFPAAPKSAAEARAEAENEEPVGDPASADARPAAGEASLADATDPDGDTAKKKGGLLGLFRRQ